MCSPRLRRRHELGHHRRGGSGASAYCNAISSYATRCNITNPCTTNAVQQCATTASSYSAAALAALADCITGIACTDAGVSAADGCSQTKLAGATPTATQAKLAADYCAACASATQTAAQCEAAFYATAGVSEGGTIVGEGPGAGLLPFSDAVATSVDSQCIPKLADAGILGCVGTFDVCAAQVVAASAPPATVSCTFDGG